MFHHKQKKHTVDILFVLILFGVFAFSALMLVIMGSSVYNKTVNTMEDNYSSRTSYTYITEKFRHADQEYSISIKDVNGNHAFVFQEIINNEKYETYLYIHDGYLKELFIKKGDSVPLEAGNIILKASALTITKETEQLFHCTIETNELITSFYLTARTLQQ